MRYPISHKFCAKCAKSAFKIWKGWLPMDVIRSNEKSIAYLPDVPSLIDGVCPVCEDTEEVRISRLYFLNIHGPYSSGLPDYFVIEIADRVSKDLTEMRKKFGRPYEGVFPGLIPRDKLEEYVRKRFRL